MATKNHIFVDIETSGLKLEDGAVILAIGAVAELKGKKLAGQVSEFYGVILPTPEQWAAASPQALTVNGLTWAYLCEHGKPLQRVVEDFTQWVYENKITATSHVHVGQNPAFDLCFLKHFMQAELEFVGYPLYGECVDNRDLYGILESRRVMPYLAREQGGRTSERISAALGLEPEPLPHNALEGARAVQRNFNRLCELVNPH